MKKAWFLLLILSLANSVCNSCKNKVTWISIDCQDPSSRGNPSFSLPHHPHRLLTIGKDIPNITKLFNCFLTVKWIDNPTRNINLHLLACSLQLYKNPFSLQQSRTAASNSLIESIRPHHWYPVFCLRLKPMIWPISTCYYFRFR